MMIHVPPAAKEAAKRYASNPEFKALVDRIVELSQETRLFPHEIRDAGYLAAIRCAERSTFHVTLRSPGRSTNTPED